MTDNDWNKYFKRQLTAAELELADFKRAIAQHGLKVFHRDISGERNMTQQHLKELEEQVEEYKRVLCAT